MSSGHIRGEILVSSISRGFKKKSELLQPYVRPPLYLYLVWHVLQKQDAEDFPPGNCAGQSARRAAQRGRLGCFPLHLQARQVGSSFIVVFASCLMFLTVFRIRIHRIHIVLGLPEPSIMLQSSSRNSYKNLFPNVL
jgi:hypothetical protein